MAITFRGTCGLSASRTNQSLLISASTQPIAAGELVVVTVAIDNYISDPTNNDRSIASVALDGNNFTQAGGSTWDMPANTFVGVSIWYMVAPVAIPSGRNFIISYANTSAPVRCSFVAQFFSLTGAGVVAPFFPSTSSRSFQGTAVDPPSMDITTVNAERLRIRSIGGRNVGTTVSAQFVGTAGWIPTQTSTGMQASTPNWEILVFTESSIFTGTSKVSDPTAGSNPQPNASAYVVFEEGPITGTLAATEGSDSASFSGISNHNLGTLEAYEGAVWLTADSTLYTADDDVTRVNTAGQIRDIANFAGQVVLGVAGTLAATEATTDTAAFAGKVGLIGTLAATDGADVASFAGTVRTLATLAATEGADTAAFTGTARMNAALAATENRDTAAFSGVAFFAVTGTLAATEGADTAAFIGLLSESGVLAATEEADEAAFTGVITNAGVLEAVEDSPDTAVFDGEVAWTGTLEATEDTQDTAEFAGITGAIGTLAATEVGDSAQFAGYLSLVDEKVGVLNAFEDQVGGYSEPRADSTLVTADNTLFHVSIDYYGQDRAYFVGELIVGAQLVATEAADTASFVGGVAVTGVMAGFETWDIANFQGSVGDVIFGRLEAREERDTALFSEPELDIRGVLEAVEGSDIAYFTMARWEDVEEGAGLENEILRTVWLTGQGGRVVWLENEVEDTSFLQNLDPEMVSLLAEQQRITELRP